MLRALLSDDLPRSRWLSVALIVLVLGLAFAPFLFPGAKSLNVALKPAPLNSRPVPGGPSMM